MGCKWPTGERNTRPHLPHALSVYAFGSQVTGTANEHSDLDLAVLVAGYAEPLVLWELADRLSGMVNCPVDLLANNHWIDRPLADALQRMVAFRNIAVHDYKSLINAILVSIVTDHLDEFLQFTKGVLVRDGQP